MGLAPNGNELLSRARTDLRAGVAVVLMRGGRAALIFATETLRPERLALAQKLGAPVLAITKRRCQTLKLQAHDGDLARISLAKNADIDWVFSISDPIYDLKTAPKGPLHPVRNGNADLHRGAIRLVKSALLLPAAIVIEINNGAAFALQHNLSLIDLNAIKDTAEISPLSSVISASLPLAAARTAKLQVFRPNNGAEEHYAVQIGQPDLDAAVLVRLHSACFTGDLLGSLKCDCGAQLNDSLKQMGGQGSGVLLYLNQEGRGIGLANKMRAYSLQNQGFDTVQANHRLGFEDDERDFRIGANILKTMGISNVHLLTNNPAKVNMLIAEGINVSKRVPLLVGHSCDNKDYLKTKAEKSGHIL